MVLAYGLLAVLFFASSHIVYAHLERPIISYVYGSQAYSSGLRIVGRNGILSDGRRLPIGWNGARAIGSFVLSMPVWLSYVAVLAFFGLLPPDRIQKQWEARRSSSENE